MKTLTRLGVFTAAAAWSCRGLVGAPGAPDSAQEAAPKPARIVLRSVMPEPWQGTGLRAYGLTRTDYGRILKHVPAAARAIPVREAPGTVQHGDKSVDVPLVGTTAAYAGPHAVKVVRGRFLTETDGRKRENVAVIGRRVARDLFLDEDPIGQSVRLGGNYFLVVGVAAEASAPPDREKSAEPRGADLQVFIPVTTMRIRLGDMVVVRERGSFERRAYELSRIEISVGDGGSVRSAAESIRRLLGAFHEQPDYSVEILESVP